MPRVNLGGFAIYNKKMFLARYARVFLDTLASNDLPFGAGILHLNLSTPCI